MIFMPTLTLFCIALILQAQLQSHGIQFYLGMFDSEEEAARAYDRKAREEKTGRSMVNFSGTSADGSDLGYTDSNYMNPMGLPSMMYNNGSFNSKYIEGGPDSKRQRTDQSPYFGVGPSTGTAAAERTSAEKILARKLDYASTTENMRVLWERHCQVAQRLLLARVTQAKLLELQSIAPDSEKEQLLTSLSEELVLLAVVKAQLEEAVSRCLVMGLEFNTSQGGAEALTGGSSMPVSAAALSAKQWRDSYMPSQLHSNALGLAEKDLNPTATFPVDYSAAAAMGVYPATSVTTSAHRNSMYANSVPPIDRTQCSVTPNMRGYEGLLTTQQVYPWSSYFNYSSLGTTPYDTTTGSTAGSIPAGMGIPKPYDLNMSMGGHGVGALSPYGLLGHDLTMSGALGMHPSQGLGGAALYPTNGLGLGGRHIEGIHSSLPVGSHSLPGLGEGIGAGMSHQSEGNPGKGYPAPMPLSTLTSALPSVQLPAGRPPTSDSALETSASTSTTVRSNITDKQPSLVKPTTTAGPSMGAAVTSNAKFDTSTTNATIQPQDKGDGSRDGNGTPIIPTSVSMTPNIRGDAGGGSEVSASTAVAAQSTPTGSAAALVPTTAVPSVLPQTAPSKPAAHPSKQLVRHKVVGGRPPRSAVTTAPSTAEQQTETSATASNQGHISTHTTHTQEAVADSKTAGYYSADTKGEMETVTVEATKNKNKRSSSRKK